MKRQWMIILLTLPLISSCITANTSLKEKKETKTFVAFSLDVAKAKIKSAQGQGKEFRKVFPEVYRLGYMSKPIGLVFDPVSGDTILIGEKGNSSNLFLDDFASALRSVYFYNDYPKLTIEPENGNPEAKWHQVIMTERIKNSHFGQVFFESDYLLKKISLNLVRIKVPGFKTQYHRMVREKKNNPVFSRFWLNPLPVDFPVSASENVIYITRYPIQVSTESLYSKNVTENSCIKFAQDFTHRFDEFAKEFPVFADLENLQRLVGIAGSISSMAFSPDLDFWLLGYEIKKVQIPQKVKGLNNIYGDLTAIKKSCGGVDSTFLNLRLKASDPTAYTDLANLVIKSRPSEDALFWNFPLQEYKFSFVAQSGVDISEIEKLIAEGVTSALKKESSETIENFSEVIKLAPDFAQAYLFRATAYTAQGDYDKAIADCQRVIEIEGKSIISSLAYFISGMSYQKKGLNEEALSNYSKTLEINPGFVFAWFKREDLLEKEELLSDLKKGKINIKEKQDLKSQETEEPIPILWEPESRTIWVNLAEFLNPKYGGGEVSVGDVLSDQMAPFRVIGFSLITDNLSLPRNCIFQVPPNLRQTLVTTYKVSQSYTQRNYNFNSVPNTYQNVPHVNTPRYNYNPPPIRPTFPMSTPTWNTGSGISNKFPSQNKIPSTPKYKTNYNPFPSISDDR